MKLLPLLALLLLVGIMSAQTMDGPPGPCQQAAIWHLHQAMRFSQAPDQGFHRGAAEAAQELAALGDDCQGWEDEASRPGPDGSMAADSSDALSASQAQVKA